jgi:uncharacterized membrane protein YidH (DUF202 family)
MKSIIILATIVLIITGIGGFGRLKEQNKKTQVISERKLMIWSILSLVIAFVNIVYLLYSYFSEIEN